MADKEYRSFVGVVIKDPKDDTTRNGKQVRRLNVALANAKDKYVGVTVWSENHGNIEIGRGDLIFANGPYTQRTVDGTTYHDLNASSFAVLAKNNYQAAGDSSSSGGNDWPAPEADDDPFHHTERRFGGQHDHHAQR